MRIRHVIPTVGPQAPADLLHAQEITLAATERALRCTDPDITVEVRAIHSPEEPLDAPEWLVDSPVLDRSVLDFGEFPVPRPLPLLADVLGGLGDPDEYDLAVYTNVDIAPHPLLYDLIRDIHLDGYDAFSITRRTVHPRFGGSTTAQLATSLGVSHPGHDCFVMTPDLVDADVGNVVLGARWVARTLLWNLTLRAERYQTFSDLHATFHIGDDQAWTSPAFAPFEDFNEREAQGVVERLCERFGESRVEGLVSTRPFLQAMRTGEPIENPPPRSAKVSSSRGPHISGSRRLIFSANSGRSGSQFLAELLDASPHVEAGHELEPTMIGPWLRDVVHNGPEPSRELRRVKADAIRAELGSLRYGAIYADTSHMFVKTFGDVVLDDHPHHLVSIVVLRRDPIAVARSFYQLDYMGMRNDHWPSWMPPPTARAAVFHIPPEAIRHQFDLIFGYLVDVDARTAVMREQAPGANWVDARLEEITTVEGASKLFAELGLAPPRGLADVVARQINDRTGVKSRFDQPITRTAVVDHWRDFAERFGHRPEVAAFAAHYDELVVPS